MALNTQWHVASVIAGCGIAGLGTGDRVVFRLAGGQVHVIGHGGCTARLSLAAAKRHLETLRTPDCRPVKACNQSKLCERWDGVVEARRFDGAGRRAA